VVLIRWVIESRHSAWCCSATELEDDSKQKLKVSMVSWDSSDKWVITAVSDHTLKIWNSETGEFGCVAISVRSVHGCVSAFCLACVGFSRGWAVASNHYTAS
jgi:WD40 repeat protein